jgi:hypothetical protein
MQNNRIIHDTIRVISSENDILISLLDCCFVSALSRDHIPFHSSWRAPLSLLLELGIVHIHRHGIVQNFSIGRMSEAPRKTVVSNNRTALLLAPVLLLYGAWFWFELCRWVLSRDSYKWNSAAWGPSRQLTIRAAVQYSRRPMAGCTLILPCKGLEALHVYILVFWRLLA